LFVSEGRVPPFVRLPQEQAAALDRMTQATERRRKRTLGCIALGAVADARSAVMLAHLSCRGCGLPVFEHSAVVGLGLLGELALGPTDRDVGAPDAPRASWRTSARRP
jgi:hypothetical protein